ncbi:MAG: deoxyribodipyrimidine photolyase, partial [Pseudomonadota bacterium]
LDHLEAARAARAQVWSVRRGPDFRETADAIQDKHGSRKSGLPPTARRRTTKARATKSAPKNGGPQLALDM